MEEQIKKSPTGISFDKIPNCEGEPGGFRFMRRHYIGDPSRTLEQVILKEMEP